jgi:aryl carrier-like protein
MVPSIYIPVSRLPWTLAGKLDRQRLRAIAGGIPSQQMPMYKLSGLSKKLQPTTLMQRKLQKVWSKVLNLDANSINKDDSFFRLGGDSVGAMKLVAAVRMEDVVLTVMNVFKNPKLSDMAMLCDQSGNTCVSSVEKLSMIQDVASPELLLNELAERCDVQPSEIEDVYPCSSLQEGLVTSSLRQAGAYVATNVFELPESIDIERFKLSMQRTVNSVDILRSRIVNAQSLKSYQVVLQPQPIAWNYSESLEDSKNIANNVPGKNGGMLAQYTIVNSEASGSRYFVWTLHHALYDAWSLPAIMKLVSRFYYENCAEVSVASVPFANFVKYLEDTDIKASGEFWKAKFRGASSTHFPTVASSSVTNEPSNTSSRHSIYYEKGRLGMDITIPTILRAAWALVVGSQTGSDDIIYGETLSGRDISLPGIGDILGPTLTTVPTRVEIDRDATIGHFLKNLHEKATEVIPYQHTGLQNIKRLGPSMSIACDFKNLLVLQSAEESNDQPQILRPLEEELEQESFFTYPLVVECSIESNKLGLTVHHDETVITSWQVKRIVYQLDALVQQLIDASQEPARKVSELRLTSPEDIQVLKEWNNTSFEHVEESLASLFLKTAARQPNTIAIHAWDGQLNYDQARQHATKLAHFLVRQGVQTETLVPCCMVLPTVQGPLRQLG